jgi:hypothetical protein
MTELFSPSAMMFDLNYGNPSGTEILSSRQFSTESGPLPFDFHLSGPLSGDLRSRRFADGEEVSEAAHKWLRPQLKPFLSEGIRKPVGCWTNFGKTMHGDYV